MQFFDPAIIIKVLPYASQNHHYACSTLESLSSTIRLTASVAIEDYIDKPKPNMLDDSEAILSFQL